MSNGSVRILRIRNVIEICGFSRSTIYEKINPKSLRYDLSFPRPIKLGASAIGWPEHEVKAWIEERMQSRQNKGAEA